jgi:hypothetical protein
MFSSKLVIVEGIPGSGKTTTARGVDGWLRRAGAFTRLFLEGDLDHPADFESVACLREDAYRALLAKYPTAKADLEMLAEHQGGEVLISFRKLRQPPAGLCEELARSDVYNLAREDFLRLTYERWEEFAARAGQGSAVHVFECCFLQNQLTTLMAVHNLDEAALSRQVLRIAAALGPLQPVMIYLEPASVRASLEKIIEERPTEWLDFVIQYTTGGAWGQARGLSGLEGMMRFYEERVEMERALFGQLGWRGLWVRQGERPDWDAIRAEVETFLRGA